MNEKRRERLRLAVGLVEKATTLIEISLDEEQNCLDNIPENLQNSERYEHIETAVEKLSDAIDCLEEAKANITGAVEC